MAGAQREFICTQGVGGRTLGIDDAHRVTGFRQWGSTDSDGCAQATSTFRPVRGPIRIGTWEVIDICRFRDGKIIEHWGIPDRFWIMERIGMPSPPSWLLKLLVKRRKK